MNLEEFKKIGVRFSSKSTISCSEGIGLMEGECITYATCKDCLEKNTEAHYKAIIKHKYCICLESRKTVNFFGEDLCLGFEDCSECMERTIRFLDRGFKTKFQDLKEKRRTNDSDKQKES